MLENMLSGSTDVVFTVIGVVFVLGLVGIYVVQRLPFKWTWLERTIDHMTEDIDDSDQFPR